MRRSTWSRTSMEPATTTILPRPAAQELAEQAGGGATGRHVVDADVAMAREARGVGHQGDHGDVGGVEAAEFRPHRLGLGGDQRHAVHSLGFQLAQRGGQRVAIEGRHGADVDMDAFAGQPLACLARFRLPGGGMKSLGPSGITNASLGMRLRASAAAEASRTKPSRSTAAFTRSAVAGRTPGRSLSTRSTVARPTPAARATSWTVGRMNTPR